jgi:hypothetical protein
MLLLAGLDGGEFTEGHELDSKTSCRLRPPPSIPFDLCVAVEAQDDFDVIRQHHGPDLPPQPVKRYCDDRLVQVGAAVPT